MALLLLEDMRLEQIQEHPSGAKPGLQPSLRVPLGIQGDHQPGQRGATMDPVEPAVDEPSCLMSHHVVVLLANC